MLAGQKPLHEIRQATHGRASPLGQSANAAGNEPPGTTEFAPRLFNAGNKPPKGRRPSKSSLAKATRIKARKKADTTAALASRFPKTESE